MSDKRFGRSTQPHQNQPSSSSQDPHSLHHNPHASTNQLVQSLRNLNLGQGQPRPPGPPQPSNNPSDGHSPSRDNDEIVQRGLQELFINSEVAARFLSSFDQTPLGQRRRNVFQSIFLSRHAEIGNRQGNKLLDLIAKSDHRDIERFLNRISCVVDFMSADDFLARDLPVPFTTATSNSSSQSSMKNLEFVKDPLIFRYLTISASQVRTTVTAFNRATAKVKKYFYDQPLEKRVVVEGDVLDVCLTNMLLPVVRFINELLKIWQDERHVPVENRMIVSIRAQYRPVEVSTRNIYVDHVLILVKQDLSDTSSQHILVIHEAKIVKSLDEEEWDQRVRTCASQGALPLEPNSGSPEMAKMIPQIRKDMFLGLIAPMLYYPILCTTSA